VFGNVSLNGFAVLTFAPAAVLLHATKCHPAAAVAVNALVDALAPVCTAAGLTVPLPAGDTLGVIVV